MSTTADQSVAVTPIPIHLIDPCPVNPRKNFDEAQLAELTLSVKEMGVTNPVIVRQRWPPVDGEGDQAEQRYELVSGHRRTEAARRAGLADVPAIIRELTDQEALDLAIVDNLQRVDLSPMEEAEAYRVLLRAMGTADDEVQNHAHEIALKAGKTQRYVVQRLKLLSLMEEARGVMRLGLLSLEMALLIARLQPEDQGNALLYAIDHRKASKGRTLQERITSAVENLQGDQAHWFRQSTEKELREWIATNITLSLKSAPWALDDAELIPEASACTTCPKRVGNNAVLFGDLTAQENTCTDPACYESKQKAFVKLTVKESAESGAPVLKLSTSQSHLPIKVGSDLLKTTFKQGQWVEAKKGSCPDTHRGVTQEGQFKTVCVNQKCKVHKHEVQQPQQRGERVSAAELELRRKKETETREFLEKTEAPIRRKVWDAILAKLDTSSALRLVNDEDSGAPAIRKESLKLFPRASGVQLEALTAFAITFGPELRVNGYWLLEPNGVTRERQRLWEVAKSIGVNADAIAAKHFHDGGSIAPAADVLYPKGIPWPKREKQPAASTPQKKAAGKKVAKKAAKKGGRK